MNQQIKQSHQNNDVIVQSLNDFMVVEIYHFITKLSFCRLYLFLQQIYYEHTQCLTLKEKKESF